MNYYNCLLSLGNQGKNCNREVSNPEITCPTIMADQRDGTGQGQGPKNTVTHEIKMIGKIREALPILWS